MDDVELKNPVNSYYVQRYYGWDLCLEGFVVLKEVNGIYRKLTLSS